MSYSIHCFKPAEPQPPIDWGDPFDPRTWPEDNPEIASPLSFIGKYFGRKDRYFILLSVGDLDLLDQHTYNVNFNGKLYLARRYYEGGKCRARFFHRDVMLRQSEPPTEKHVIVDHINGNSLDNRRENLRWATPWENSVNIHGIYHRQMRFNFETHQFER